MLAHEMDAVLAHSLDSWTVNLLGRLLVVIDNMFIFCLAHPLGK